MKMKQLNKSTFEGSTACHRLNKHFRCNKPSHVLMLTNNGVWRPICDRHIDILEKAEDEWNGERLP